VSQNGIGRIEVKNCGIMGNSSDGLGLANFAQLNQILRKHHEQNLSLKMAATLLQTEQRELSGMPIIDDQKADLQGISGRQTDSEVETAEETSDDSSRPVIELGDLSTGAEAEVNRIKSNMIALSGEISQIRREHVRLAANYQELTGELRDIKLVLAKVHAKELRAIVRASSWMESLRLLREMFQKGPKHRKNQPTGNRVSFLRK